MSNKIPKHDKVIKSIGNKVQYYRKMKDLTQEELANKINKTVETISNVERGIFGVKIETLFDLSEALQIELCDLFVDVKIKQGSKSAKKIKEIINKISAQNDDTIAAIDKVVSEICRVAEEKN